IGRCRIISPGAWVYSTYFSSVCSEIILNPLVMRVIVLSIFSICFILHPSLAQQPQVNDSSDTYTYILEEKIESIAENAEDNTDYTTLLDPLNYYREHPINLNNTSREELRELSLLNDIQINALFNHISSNGKLIALE